MEGAAGGVALVPPGLGAPPDGKPSFKRPDLLATR